MCHYRQKEHGSKDESGTLYGNLSLDYLYNLIGGLGFIRDNGMLWLPVKSLWRVEVHPLGKRILSNWYCANYSLIVFVKVKWKNG